VESSVALYYLSCLACGHEAARFLKTAKEATEQACAFCQGPMKRNPRPPSSQVMETLDNGHMGRKVERLKDAEELHQDRARNDPRLKPP
jgi:hypothetical protein